MTYTDNKPQEQGSTAEDFIQDEEKEAGVWDPTEMADRENDREFCGDCNAPLNISKKGNKYCSALCWTLSNERILCVECKQHDHHVRFKRCQKCNKDLSLRTKAADIGYDDGRDQLAW